MADKLKAMTKRSACSLLSKGNKGVVLGVRATPVRWSTTSAPSSSCLVPAVQVPASYSYSPSYSPLRTTSSCGASSKRSALMMAKMKATGLSQQSFASCGTAWSSRAFVGTAHRAEAARWKGEGTGGSGLRRSLAGCGSARVVGCGSSPSTEVKTAAAGSSQETDGTAAGVLGGSEIRKRFIDFYVSRGHKHLPSSSLVPDDPTVLLTIAGMLQFKPIFLGQEKKKYDCCTTTQKCVRTNDIENVGVTARHHTFFEMLGNFSFGDYFKEGAIRHAWELCTKVFPLNPERIWISVYKDDDESYEIWEKSIGIPKERIVRLGEKDNFWSSGPTGPCGPCTELYYDFSPELGAEGADLEDDDRFIEFYNLVFMQYNRTPDKELEPLKVKCVDTGMGLERMAQILQGKPNNYETDLIYPLMEKACASAGVEYHKLDERMKQACKVIGDHTRAVVYLISDGVTPSNIGRGYIVRRLLRRVVLKGRLLGAEKGKLFTPEIAEIAVGMSNDCDPEVAKNSQRILSEIAREEERFVKTLDRGEAILSDLLEKASTDKSKSLKGADAFMLYDTYGFPLEITQELAAEKGIDVDLEGFERAMEDARTLSRSAHEAVDMTLNDYEGTLAKTLPSTEFCGYTDLDAESEVLSVIKDKEQVSSSQEGEKIKLVLDRTPFYAESGGQVGDRGVLVSDNCKVNVVDVQKVAGGLLYLHEGIVEEGSLAVGDRVSAQVDKKFRDGCKIHHTSTHLLQTALKSVLGDDVCQAGSIVKPDTLRFDFNYPEAMTGAQIKEVERLVNSWVAGNNETVVDEMPIAEAKAKGATAMFGEKYGDVVRVVSVMSEQGESVSMELCGGTHVERTQEIRGLKVVSESGIASGIRRIEAVAGDQVIDYLGAADDIVKSLSSQLKIKREEIVPRISTLMNDLKASQGMVSKLKEELAVAKTAALAGKVVSINGFKAVFESIDDMDSKVLSAAAQQLQSSLGEDAAVVLVTKVSDKKVSLVAAFGADLLERKMHAGKFVSSVAEVCGGKGGGRPNLAQAGGTDPSKIEEAVRYAETQFKELSQ